MMEMFCNKWWYLHMFVNILKTTDLYTPSGLII